jgi:hypothetical protein
MTTTTHTNDAHIAKLAVSDAASTADDLVREGGLDALAECLTPGQLGASEGLCNALGLEGTAKYLGVPLTESRDELHAALAVYDREHRECLAHELAERTAASVSS